MIYNNQKGQTKGTTMKKYKHIYVVGRLSDEENSHYTYKNLTANEALKCFERDLRDEDPVAFDRHSEKYGDFPVIYDCVLVSNSPIKPIGN